MQRNAWPIIIGGCHRSGTSLIRRILDAHSRIYCGPEVKFFRDFYSDYNVYDQAEHIRYVASARAILPEDELLQILGHTFIKLQERAAERAGKPRWADKNPENVLYLADWERLLGREWLMIHVVRNPLDTLASIKEIKFPLTIPSDLEDRIDFFRQYTEAGLEFGRSHPEHYCRIIYEEFVASPRSQVEELMTWLGEAFEPSQLRFNEVSHQFGIEDPKIAGTSEIHQESRGRWPSILTPEEARRIWERTRDLWLAIDPECRYVVPAPP